MNKTRADRRFGMLKKLFILFLCVLMGFPFVMTVSVSLQTMGEIYSSDLNLIPEVLQFGNYRDAMSNGNWGLYFYNSIVVTVITVIISLVINAMAGFVFARCKIDIFRVLKMLQKHRLHPVTEPRTVGQPQPVYQHSLHPFSFCNVSNAGRRGRRPLHF